MRVEARVLTELAGAHRGGTSYAASSAGPAPRSSPSFEERLGAETTRYFDEVTTWEVHAAFETELVAVPGVVELVDALHAAGVPTCVASSGSHAKMRRTLGVTGLYERFAGGSSASTRSATASPRRTCSCTPRSGCDRAGAWWSRTAYGVRAAVAAGMTAFGFAGGLTSGEVLADAGAVVFDTMADLVDVLSPQPAAEPAAASSSPSPPTMCVAIGVPSPTGG